MVDATVQRSRGQFQIARALWYAGPRQTEIRTTQLTNASQDFVTVQTHFTGISRGTERLIWSGGVASSEWERMRAPFQEGAFPYPVKYGYSAAGEVIGGPPEMMGRRVFALYPHQTVFQVPIANTTLVPDDVPSRRATLGANMETALNAVWDSAAGPADRIVIVGAGIVGLLVASIAAQLPAAHVHVLDVEPTRRQLVESLGATYGTPDDVGGDADIVFHTSATEAGLASAIASCGFEAKLIEMSWYGANDISVNLGGAFHSKRLQFSSSQVGHVATSRRARWDYARRLKSAMELLANPALDQLVSEDVAFDDLPQRLGGILDGASAELPPVVNYGDASS